MALVRPSGFLRRFLCALPSILGHKRGTIVPLCLAGYFVTFLFLYLIFVRNFIP